MLENTAAAVVPIIAIMVSPQTGAVPNKYHVSEAEGLDALRHLASHFDEVAVPKHGAYVDHPAQATDGSAHRKRDDRHVGRKADDDC